MRENNTAYHNLCMAVIISGVYVLTDCCRNGLVGNLCVSGKGGWEDLFSGNAATAILYGIQNILGEVESLIAAFLSTLSIY